MFKAIIFIAIGAVGAYLYMNPGDVDGSLEMLKQGVNKGAQMCGVSASAYTGKARRLVQVERSIL